ncbi:Serine/threonine-protein kinase Nek6 [Vulpes lagopus]
MAGQPSHMPHGGSPNNLCHTPGPAHTPDPETPKHLVFSWLIGRLPDREEGRPRTVQRGVQGHLPAG